MTWWTITSLITPPENAAAWLLDGHALLFAAPGVIVAPDSWRDAELAQAALAVRLAANPAIALRAYLEDWSLSRIVQELW